MDLISVRRELREVEWRLFLLYRSGSWSEVETAALWAEVDRLDALLSDWFG